MVMMSYIKCSVEQSQLSVIIKTTAAVNLLTEIKKHSVTCLLALSPSVCSSTLKVGEAKVKSLSRVRLLASPWTVAHQASPSLGFSRQEYWNGLPFPSPGHIPDPGIEPRSPALEADALSSEPQVIGTFLKRT